MLQSWPKVYEKILINCTRRFKAPFWFIRQLVGQKLYILQDSIGHCNTIAIHWRNSKRHLCDIRFLAIRKHLRKWQKPRGKYSPYERTVWVASSVYTGKVSMFTICSMIWIKRIRKLVKLYYQRDHHIMQFLEFIYPYNISVNLTSSSLIYSAWYNTYAI